MAQDGDLEAARMLLRSSAVNLENLAAAGHATPELLASQALTSQYMSSLNANQFDDGLAKSMKYTAYRARSSR